jgi:hypothetical protein
MYFDQRRLRNFKNTICLAFDKQEALSALSTQEDLMLNMLSVSPDDAPVVGSMKKFPNVFLNVGHGQRAAGLAFFSGQMISLQVDDLKENKEYVSCDVLSEKISPKRFYN